MPKNPPTCTKCGTPAVKNGTYKRTKQYWYCTACSAPVNNSRPTLAERKWFLRFHHHVTSNATIADIARAENVSPATVSRRFKSFWLIQVPQPVDPHRVHDQIFLDGTYLTGGCLLLATTKTHVIAWHWCKHENTAAYSALIERIAPPLIVTIDGGQGAQKAIKKHWPTTKIQRCTFHAFNAVKRQTTTHPRTPQGKQIYKLAKLLLKVNTLKAATEWIIAVHEFGRQHRAWLDEKTTIELPNGTSRQEFTHKRVRTAYNSLVTLIRRNQLFVYLDPPQEVLEPDNISATTNALEGGFNAKVKRHADAHRGQKPEYQRTTIDWLL